ncbi:MAG TPA: rhodanese-like domain-containing protein [Acidimicrobiales bacterium]|nr:rhodanese-like domain-containing protein [Acidimicrobiales bacterium]
MDAPEVTTEELAVARDAGAVVVDVRTDEEWAAGHVPGIRHIPLAELADRWEAELPDDETIYVICHTDGRSRAAASALIKAGADAVVVVGGTVKWAEEGRPLES